MAKSYNTFSEELKKVFGCRVHRISVDAGFTCPNRDGTVGNGGCAYCRNGSGASWIARNLSVSDQIESGKEVIRRRFKAERFIAYFQAYSNTYGNVDTLRRLYDDALSVKDVVGLFVSTRPDCLSTEILDLLQSYAAKTYFWLELGLQSPVDRTLKFINRGHDFTSFVESVRRCKERGIRVCAHIILGLPGESRDEMLSSSAVLSDMGVDGVKIHSLHVIKGTHFAKLYEKGEIKVMEVREYIELVCDYLERLNQDIIIHRLTGEEGREHLTAPLWSLDKFEVLNAIDAEMKKRGSCQGKALIEVSQRQVKAVYYQYGYRKGS